LKDTSEISKILLFGKIGEDDVEKILEEANEEGIIHI